MCISINMYTGFMCIYTVYAAVLRKKLTEDGNPAVFFNFFTLCSSCKRKFAVCLYVDEEKNGSYRICLHTN
jgi:hypothetical protein